MKLLWICSVRVVTQLNNLSLHNNLFNIKSFNFTVFNQMWTFYIEFQIFSLICLSFCLITCLSGCLFVCVSASILAVLLWTIFLVLSVSNLVHFFISLTIFSENICARARWTGKPSNREAMQNGITSQRDSIKRLYVQEVLSNFVKHKNGQECQDIL